MTLYEGDCFTVLPEHVPDESVDLIYIDPPFYTDRNFAAFDDRFESMDVYIGWLKFRIRECYRVLKPTGSIYLHCDWHANAYLRIPMDNIFGYDNMRDEIIWSYSKVGGTQKKYLKWHETIFRYTKSDDYTFNMDEVREEYSQSVLKSLKTDEKGKYYTRGLGSDPSIKRIKETYVHPKGKVPGDV